MLSLRRAWLNVWSAHLLCGGHKRFLNWESNKSTFFQDKVPSQIGLHIFFFILIIMFYILISTISTTKWVSNPWQLVPTVHQATQSNWIALDYSELNLPYNLPLHVCQTLHLKLPQWGTQNPLDGDTWFVGFITHRDVQSVFPNSFEIDTS